MPLRITIEIIPNGDEHRAEILERITVTQVRKFDDNIGGRRLYAIRDDLHGYDIGSVTHERKQGAVTLARAALKRLRSTPTFPTERPAPK